MFGRRRRRGRHRAGRGSVRFDPTWIAGHGYVGEDEEFDDIVGPYDSSAVPEDGISRLDLGSVRLPLPEGAQLQVEVEPEGPVKAVHVVTSLGRLTISAYAAPRSTGLWRDVSEELLEQLKNEGGKAQFERGEWGLEIRAVMPKAALCFVGIDGPRWLLRGVAAGPLHQAEATAAALHDVLRDTVVVRGEEPLPVRTPLALQLPDAIARHIDQAQGSEA
ncbi:DUF3710 domain-containing protein [Pseudonocardiaceae bacterium YIM PH 21723]|nr:DUF3710 domain-containing protein [Pseudonocardiaceae bacterium YIM PH 21723]